MAYALSASCVFVVGCVGEIEPPDGVAINDVLEDGGDLPPYDDDPQLGKGLGKDAAARASGDGGKLASDSDGGSMLDPSVGDAGDGSSGAGGDAGNPPMTGTLTPGALRWVGRVDHSDPSAARFSWQGAGVIATITGTTIAVKLRTEGTDTVFFQPVIDGKTAARFEVKSGSDQVITLASGLSSGDHDVELYRDTEGTYGISTFLGFTSGTLKGAKSGNGRLIEIVGDSISAAFGALGSESHGSTTTSCNWSAANSPWYQSYAALAGHALGAEVSTLARSGWGMYRDNGNNTSNVLPNVYDNTFGENATLKWDFAPKPAAVVINLGTNDWNSGDPGTAYETAYKAFLSRVRGHYPDAWILLTIGSMFEKARLDQVDARLKNVVAALSAAGDTKVATFDLGSQDATTTGCQWHPNAAEHKIMAGILQKQLSAKLGW